MAKIDRYNGNLKAFASDATGTERTIFGDTAQSDELDANITADLLRGWGVVGPTFNPTKQDFNGLGFTLGQLIAYLHQQGIPEWNTSQEYYRGSVVTTLAGIYRLKNGGDATVDPDNDNGTNWELAPTRAQVDAKADKATTYTETEVDSLLDDKADQATTYTETEVDSLLDAKADQATTYTETEVDGLLDAKAAISGQAFSGNISAPNLSGTNTGDQDLSGKADKATTYTETEVDGLLDAKASLQAADILVTVGTGGDYPTINAALEYLSKLQPVYASAGITATINLLTGFVMAEQVLVRGLDMGWVTITGADAETTITNTALTTDFTTAVYGFDSYPAFGVSKGGVLPRIDQLFRFDVANVGGEKRGIMAVGAGSSADVLAGAGVNDAGTDGIYADNGSTIYAEGAVASGAGSYGINASSGSTINAEGANASGAGTYGILATRGSTINAGGANASGAGTYGILATSGSTINAKGADASGAGSYGINASSGSTINAGGATGTLSQAINTVTNNGIIFQ